ncbi:MAG: GtrA family protein, partial [Kiritimatiellaeota bacterium]|nr:GtrA family protein [Kiritimatiellota bacterium]
WGPPVVGTLCGAAATGVGFILFYVFAAWLWPCLTEDDFVRRLLDLPVMKTDAGIDADALRGSRAKWCNILGFVLSNAVAYATNVWLVFKPGRHKWYVELLLFYAASSVAALIGSFGMEFLIKRFGLMTTLAFAANIVAAFMINYAMRKFVIFKG